MEQVQAQLIEDEERFRKLQLSDQTNFNDRLDNISVSVFPCSIEVLANKAPRSLDTAFV